MKHNRLARTVAFALCFLLAFEQSGFAQVAGQLDISLRLASLRNSLVSDKFRPLHLRYLAYDTQANNFKLLLDKGDFFNARAGSQAEAGRFSTRTPGPIGWAGVHGGESGTVPLLEEETRKLLNYFFVGLSLPNESFWVNLRPDSPDNIIDPLVAQTDVGKIFLEADLQLKKDTASATSPQTLEGKLYWDKLYAKAQELFGYDNLTIPTLTRPWIVPGEIIIRESPENAYIYKATLKVMLEQDYLPDSPTYKFDDPRQKSLNEYSSQLIRELILPKLTKEINTSKRYAPLRQVYYSLILAQWFKERYWGRDGLYSRLINRQELTGLTSKEPWSQETYFQAYQKSFKDGEYNLKEPTYSPFGQTVRSYFSGGLNLSNPSLSAAMGEPGIPQIVGQTSTVVISGDSFRTGLGEMNIPVETFDTGEPFTVQINVGENTAETPPAVSRVAAIPAQVLEEKSIANPPTEASSSPTTLPALLGTLPFLNSQDIVTIFQTEPLVAVLGIAVQFWFMGTPFLLGMAKKRDDFRNPDNPSALPDFMANIAVRNSTSVMRHPELCARLLEIKNTFGKKMDVMLLGPGVADINGQVFSPQLVETMAMLSDKEVSYSIVDESLKVVGPAVSSPAYVFQYPGGSVRARKKFTKGVLEALAGFLSCKPSELAEGRKFSVNIAGNVRVMLKDLASPELDYGENQRDIIIATFSLMYALGDMEKRYKDKAALQNARLRLLARVIKSLKPQGRLLVWSGELDSVLNEGVPGVSSADFPYNEKFLVAVLAPYGVSISVKKFGDIIEITRSPDIGAASAVSAGASLVTPDHLTFLKEKNIAEAMEKLAGGDAAQEQQLRALGYVIGRKEIDTLLDEIGFNKVGVDFSHMNDDLLRITTTESGFLNVLMDELSDNWKHAGAGTRGFLLARKILYGKKAGVEIIGLDNGKGISALQIRLEGGYSASGHNYQGHGLFCIRDNADKDGRGFSEFNTKDEGYLCLVDNKDIMNNDPIPFNNRIVTGGTLIRIVRFTEAVDLTAKDITEAAASKTAGFNNLAFFAALPFLGPQDMVSLFQGDPLIAILATVLQVSVIGAPFLLGGIQEGSQDAPKHWWSNLMAQRHKRRQELLYQKALAELGLSEQQMREARELEKRIEGKGFVVRGGISNPTQYAILRELIGKGVMALKQKDEDDGGAEEGVYDPFVADDNMLSVKFAQRIQSIIESSFATKDTIRVLSFGCGTGIDALAAYRQASKQGQKVILDAVDINPGAVVNTEENFRLIYGALPDGVRILPVELGSQQEPGKEFRNLWDKYDIIMFNVPSIIEGESDNLAAQINKDEFTRVLTQMRDRLSDSGEIVLCTQQLAEKFVPAQLFRHERDDIDSNGIGEEKRVLLELRKSSGTKEAEAKAKPLSLSAAPAAFLEKTAVFLSRMNLDPGDNVDEVRVSADEDRYQQVRWLKAQGKGESVQLSEASESLLRQKRLPNTQGLNLIFVPTTMTAVTALSENDVVGTFGADSCTIVVGYAPDAKGARIILSHVWSSMEGSQYGIIPQLVPYLTTQPEGKGSAFLTYAPLLGMPYGQADLKPALDKLYTQFQQLKRLDKLFSHAQGKGGVIVTSEGIGLYQFINRRYELKEFIPRSQLSSSGLTPEEKPSLGAGESNLARRKRLDVSRIDKQWVKLETEAGMVVDYQGIVRSGLMAPEELFAELNALYKAIFNASDYSFSKEDPPPELLFLFIDKIGVYANTITGLMAANIYEKDGRRISNLERLGTVNGRNLQMDLESDSKYRGEALLDSYLLELRNNLGVDRAWWKSATMARKFYAGYLRSKGIKYIPYEDKYWVIVSSFQSEKIGVISRGALKPAGDKQEGVSAAPAVPGNTLPQPGPGGIDMRALPIVRQKVASDGRFAGEASGIAKASATPANDREWQEIQRMLQAGIIPSAERIKGYLGTCSSSAKDAYSQEIDKVISCIAAILRLEEEKCCATEDSLSQILVVLESGKPADELQVALANITTEEQEPQKAME